MKTGFAKVEITPPLGIDLTGYANREGVIEGIRDPLYAKAVIFETKECSVGLIGCDLIGLSADFIKSCRLQIEREVGIPGSNIMIACTHTHTGPATISLIGCGKMDADYLKNLQECIVRVTKLARRNQSPGLAGVGREQLKIGINRRGKIESDSVILKPDPDAPTDEELIVLKISDATQNNLGVIANYGCHGTSIDPKELFVSADYMGIGMARVEAAFNHKLISIFLNGGAGDVNPYPRGLYQNTLDHGQALSTKILTVLNKIECVDPESIRMRSQHISIPYKNLVTAADMKQEIERLNHKIDLLPDDVQHYDARKTLCDLLFWARSVRNQIEKDELPQHIDAEIQIIIVGNIVFAGLPFEVFSETAKLIKKDSPYPATFVISQCNGNCGYLPPRKAHAVGGYEVDSAYKYYGHPSGFVENAEEMVRETVSKLFRDAKLTD